MEAVIKKVQDIDIFYDAVNLPFIFLKFNVPRIAETGPTSGEGKVIKGGS